MNENSFKNKIKDITSQVTNTFSNLGNKLKEVNDDYQLKRNVKEAFEAKATKFILDGKKNYLGSVFYVYGIAHLNLFNKEIYFRYDEVSDNIEVGSILIKGEAEYKVVDMTKNDPISIKLKYKKENKGKKKTQKLSVSCFKIKVKKIN